MADLQGMGITVVKVPREVSNTKAGETPLFSKEAVEWAMERVLNAEE